MRPVCSVHATHVGKVSHKAVPGPDLHCSCANNLCRFTVPTSQFFFKAYQPSMHETLGLVPNTIESDVVTYVCNPSTQEAETGELKV